MPGLKTEALQQKASAMAGESVTVFSPATVANVAVGFDILGLALHSVGDTVTAEKTAEPGVRIRSVTGLPLDLPLDPAKNTAGWVVIRLLETVKPDFGVELSVKKGIPLGSGMGGSAASAVGALVAVNHLLEKPLSKPELLSYALLGEELASGSPHGDNVTPCLFGGLTLTRNLNPVDVVQIPVPASLMVVVVHPDYRLDTRMSRAVLRKELPLKDFVQQSANLAGFLAGCYTQDMNLIGRSFRDVLIEPRRSILIPGFDQAKSAALAAGALGCSISGSGPSVFALVPDRATGESVASGITASFSREGITSSFWISEVNMDGAKRVVA